MEKIDYYKEVREFFNFVGSATVKKLHNIGTVIKTRPNYNDLYFSNFGFTFVSKELEQTFKFMSCRDYLHDAIRTFVNGKVRVNGDYHPYAYDKCCPNLSMDRLLLLIQISERLNKCSLKKVSKAIKVLNDFEEFCGIPTTTAEEVELDIKHERENVDIKHVLLTGSGQYMHNPHMLSMLTLILRFCSHSNYYWYKKPSHIANWANSPKATKRDAEILRNCYRILPIIIKHRESLFGRYSVNELFPVEMEFDFHSKGGIESLCKADIGKKEINDRVTLINKNVDKALRRLHKDILYRRATRNYIL